jgi:hypothetical protein
MRKPRNRKTNGVGDDQIGYRQPPRHSQFKPGQSGNAKGRPKGARNFRTDVRATLKRLVKIRSGGKSFRMSTQEALLMRLRDGALGGDSRAADRLVALAQRYDDGDDEFATADNLTADDQQILEIYRARVLSGAAGVTEAPADSNQSVAEPSSKLPESGEGPPETASDDNGPVQRYRRQSSNEDDEKSS